MWSMVTTEFRPFVHANQNKYLKHQEYSITCIAAGKSPNCIYCYIPTETISKL